MNTAARTVFGICMLAIAGLANEAFPQWGWLVGYALGALTALAILLHWTITQEGDDGNGS